MDAKKSPLKDKPLRQAGQSVQEQLDKLFDDKFMIYFLIAGLMIFLTAFEWYRYYKNLEINPVAITIISLPVFIFCVYKIFSLIKVIKRLKLGRDGEKIVAEELEKLRASGSIVFHDIVGDKFNLDHVVLSPKGIYVVETKTYSKPDGRRAEVKLDGNSILVDGQLPERDPITQVKAASVWLHKILAQSTGKKFFVCPVILFPGWYVYEENHPDFMVLNPERFPKALERKSNMLNENDMTLAAYHLSRYIRAI